MSGTDDQRRSPARDPFRLLALRSFEVAEKTALHDPEADRPANRFNDGATDPKGRLWAGTMKDDGGPPAAVGAFYRFDPDLTSTKWVDGIFTTNGLAFSPDGKTLYAADSNRSVQTIWAADYDLAKPANPANAECSLMHAKSPAGQMVARSTPMAAIGWLVSAVGSWFA